MKIAFLVPMIAPYRVSFFEKLAELVQGDVCVFHGVKNLEDGRPPFTGPLSCRCEGFPMRSISIGGMEVCFYPGLLMSLKSYAPDVLILPDHPSSLTCWRAIHMMKRRGKSVVIWACGWDGKHVKGILRAAKRSVLRRFLGRADHVIAYSTRAQKKLVGLGYPEARIAIAYNGIELDGLNKDRNSIMAAARELRKSDKKVILYVGAMLAEKRVPFLLDAFDRLQRSCSGLELWLVGDGPARLQMEAAVNDRKIRNVVFWGRIIDDVNKFFAAADVFVLPGAGGLAINQAMYSGAIPVVGRADGTEDDLVIDGETGFRFEYDSIDSLCHAISQVLGLSPMRRTWMSRAGKRIVREKSNVDAMVCVFREVISSVPLRS